MVSEKSFSCTVVLFLACLRIADGTVGPSNLVVVAGTRMAMECRTDNGSHVFLWELERPGNSRPLTIFRNHDGELGLEPRFSSRFGVDMDESCSGFLYANKTQLDDAGIYVCRTDGEQIEMSYRAHLTVLEHEPLCETNYTAKENTTLKEGEIIWMQCTVNFRGMWPPTVEWTKHTEGDEGEEDQQIVHHGVSTVTLVNTSVTTTLIFAADFNATTYFSCRIFFQWHIVGRWKTAKNVPNYTYTWNSPRPLLHSEVQKTTEVLYVAPLPVEVVPNVPLSTISPKSDRNSDWSKGKITAAPSNAAVVAGDWMSMECRTTNDTTVFIWTLQRSNSSEIDDVFRNHDGMRGLTPEYSPDFGADMDGERCSGFLYSNATRLDDAGLYRCRARTDDDHFVVDTAHLTVLETEPVCETNYTADDNVTLAEGEIIWMQCTVNFRGMWSPSVEWKLHTDDDDDSQGQIYRGATTVTLINNRLTSTIVYVIDSSKTTYFSFRMFFQKHDGSVQATAPNLPNYTYTWRSPRLLPQQTQPKTTEEVYAAPRRPVEVRPFDTTTSKPSGGNGWYLISLILLFAVMVFVSLLVGLGIHRYVRFRRVRDLNVVYNASTSSTAPLRRLEILPPTDYDVVPSATPNIYDWIDGADGDDDVEAQTSPNCHPPLTECYSGLMAAAGNATCQYDTLDLYAKMDMVKQESAQNKRESPAYPGQENGEERYTTPVPKRGMAKPNLPSGSSDYLQMVGNVKESRIRVRPMYVKGPDDSDEDDISDRDRKVFAKDGDDYLQPGAIEWEHVPKYVFPDYVGPR